MPTGRFILSLVKTVCHDAARFSKIVMSTPNKWRDLGLIVISNGGEARDPVRQDNKSD